VSTLPDCGITSPAKGTGRFLDDIVSVTYELTEDCKQSESVGLKDYTELIIKGNGYTIFKGGTSDFHFVTRKRVQDSSGSDFSNECNLKLFDVTIDGFKNHPNGDKYGGAVLVSDMELEAHDVVFSRNYGLYRGGAIRVSGGTFYCERCTFVGNRIGEDSQADARGAAISSGNSDDLIILRDCIGADNKREGTAAQDDFLDASKTEHVSLDNLELDVAYSTGVVKLKVDMACPTDGTKSEVWGTYYPNAQSQNTGLYLTGVLDICPPQEKCVSDNAYNIKCDPTDTCTADQYVAIDSTTEVYKEHLIKHNTRNNIVVNDNSLLSTPTGMQITDAGDIYIADKGNHRIIKKSAGVTNSKITLEFGNNGASDYVYKSQNDPDIKLCLNQEYEFKRTSTGHPFRLVKDSDCTGCDTGTYSSLPTSTVTGWSDVSDGSPKDHTFTMSGTYYYVCTAHSSMVGKIIVNECGGFSVVAGLGGTSGTTTDTTGALARFKEPSTLLLDSTSDPKILYVGEFGNDCIRKIDLINDHVSDYSGTCGTSGTTDSPAKHNNIASLAWSGTDMIVIDWRCVRKISGGTLTTIAGKCGTSGDVDDTGDAARFSWIKGGSVDEDGNAYVADFNNYKVKKIVLSTGVVTTIAGDGTSGTTDGAALSTQCKPYSVIRLEPDVYLLGESNKLRLLKDGQLTTLYGGTNGDFGGYEGRMGGGNYLFRQKLTGQIFNFDTTYSSLSRFYFMGTCTACASGTNAAGDHPRVAPSTCDGSNPPTGMGGGSSGGGGGGGTCSANQIPVAERPEMMIVVGQSGQVSTSTDGIIF
jgi:predicted outer membrane repeat protein